MRESNKSFKEETLSSLWWGMSIESFKSNYKGSTYESVPGYFQHLYFPFHGHFGHAGFRFGNKGLYLIVISFVFRIKGIYLTQGDILNKSKTILKELILRYGEPTVNAPWNDKIRKFNYIWLLKDTLIHFPWDGLDAWGVQFRSIELDPEAKGIIMEIKEDSMLSTPEWYKMLPEGFKPIEEDKIKSLENLRIKYRASHENCFLSIMSTPWAVERAQYDSLNQAKRMYPQFNDRDLWRRVLLARLQTWINTVLAGGETHEYSKLSPEELLQRIEKLEINIDLILKYFNSFSDLVTFTICIEEEMGNFIDPSGILDEVNSILGRGRPTEEENQWYISIMNKLGDDA